MRTTLIKTGTYCLMHLAVAIAVAFALTGDLRASLALGVIEPLVQTVAFAFHDRFWSRFDGRGGRASTLSLHGGCTHGGLSPGQLGWSGRLLTVPVLKTFSYAVMHLIVAVAVAYALTRDWRVALAIGLIEPLVQTIAFAFHDRAWSRHERRALEPVRARA